MIWPLLAILSAVAFLVVFAWPWVSPYLDRYEAAGRLLDRLEEEWRREGEPPAKDWTNW